MESLFLISQLEYKNNTNSSNRLARASLRLVYPLKKYAFDGGKRGIANLLVRRLLDIRKIFPKGHAIKKNNCIGYVIYNTIPHIIILYYLHSMI